jgi:hypothetical protein
MIPTEARLYLTTALISMLSVGFLLSAPQWDSVLFIVAVVINAAGIGWSLVGAVQIIKKHRSAEKERLQRLDKLMGRGE